MLRLKRKEVNNVQQQNEVYPKLFTWLFIGLLITFASGYILAASPVLAVNVLSIGYIPIVIIELVIAIVMGIRIKKMNPLTTKICYTIYCITTGLTFSSLFLYYQLTSLLSIFLITSVIFAVLAIYGYKTKRDLSKFGTILLISLIVTIILSILNYFIFKTSTIDILLTIISILIFVGYIAYDMNTVKLLIHEVGEEKAAVYGAFQLYLDFINLFVRLLELFGKKED